MPTRSSKDHDFTRTALRVVEQAIGEQWDGSPIFGRVHQTLKKTPAMAAGVANRVWGVDDLVNLLEAVEPKATRPAKKSVSN